MVGTENGAAPGELGVYGERFGETWEEIGEEEEEGLS